MKIVKKWWDRLHPPTGPIFVSTPESQSEASKALADADAGLCEARGRKPQVENLVERLREQRERNHFGELVQSTMRGGG